VKEPEEERCAGDRSVRGEGGKLSVGGFGVVLHYMRHNKGEILRRTCRLHKATLPSGAGYELSFFLILNHRSKHVLRFGVFLF